MKKIFLPLCLSFCIAYTADNDIISELKPQGKKSLIDKIKEKELKLQVPRETVPVESIRYPVQTPIPKTAEALPMLQTLLHIEAGTLPNPIGISIIGSFMEEKYRIKKFNGTLGSNLGQNLCANPNNPMIPNSMKSILKIACILPKGSQIINTITGAGTTKEWKLSEGTVNTKTSAIGIKLDTWLFPFMQVFVAGTYLNMEQSTNVGIATFPSQSSGDKFIDAFVPKNFNFEVGTLSNNLDGYAFMGGTNLAIGYKGFFLSCMIAGGYVNLDDLANNISGFVQKPFMYIAPRVGYSLGGVMTAHFGVQRVELFGSTKGADLSKLTGGLVEGFNIDIDKYPVNFLIGTNFMPMRDLGISFEYVFSPDVKGLNAEIAYRF